ncbi:MAG TPA: hypothetical protein VK738_00390 [Terriglobales bacterium]|jgi:hypothetical protein|nr:hypothetical protein [Terriglobales bacterium]
MKKIMGMMLLMALVGGLAFAGDPDKAKTQTITGYLVDVACAADNASHPEPGFAAKHDKGCLQMAECVQSGYAILTDDNKVIKLDKQSNETAKKLIADTDKKDNWKISATGTLNGNLFAAQSLKLQ